MKKGTSIWNWGLFACAIGSSIDTTAPLVHVGHVSGDGILFFDDADEVYSILEAGHTQILFIYALLVIGLHVILVYTCVVMFIHLYNTFILQECIIIW